MAGRILLLILGFLVLAAPAPGEDGKKGPPGPPKEKDPKEDPAFRESVQQAIDKGVKWLLARQDGSGRFPGYSDARGDIYPLGMHALATLAVIKGGCPVDGPEVTKALKALESLYGTNRNALYTYEVGLALMVLDAKVTTSPKGKPEPKKPPKPGARDLELATELSNWIQKQQRPEGLWRYPEGGIDLSNTQYAALGLWSAHRLGVDVNKGVVRRMLEGTLERQEPTGPRVSFYDDPKAFKAAGAERRSTTTIRARGWRYLPEEEITLSDGTTKKVVYPYSGSMTSAGIAILAIGRDILGKGDPWLGTKDTLVRTSMWEGLAWIQNNWELRDNPGQAGNWPFYWIYGLERCARLSGIEYVGLHDWYHEGSIRLIDDQREDGSWPRTHRMKPKGDQNVRWWSDQVDTCFAILFLTQSTPEIRTPPPAITGG
ncbi:MAG: hypothetical protein L6Q95_01925 [Planctomycetes bacterium]|nr:hypothetical protein [Planctomycetota bacterium]